MAGITFDSELMLNQVAADSVAAGSHFVALLDAKRQPAVIGVDNQPVPKLQLIMNDKNGVNSLTNLGDLLGFPTGSTIQYFEAVQDNDLNVYLVVAIEADANDSSLYVVEPFQLVANITSLSVLPVQPVPTVRLLYMAPPSVAGQYPLVVIAGQLMGSLYSATDLSRIWVNSDGKSWSLLGDLNMPEGAQNILSVTAASHSEFGRGIWVLYETQGKVALLGEYVREESEGNYRSYYPNPAVPVGATQLGGYTGTDGNTALLVSGYEGLYASSKYSDATRSQPLQLICTSDIFCSSSHLVVAQDGSNVSVWSRSVDGSLGYILTTADALSQAIGTAIEISLGAPSTEFAVSISQPCAAIGLQCANQIIVSVDASGNLTLLRKSCDTGVWKGEPFVVWNDTDLIDIQSYTISLRAVDSNGLPVANGAVLLKSSSTNQAIMNGANVLLTSGGTWMPLSATGDLDFIIATSGIAAQPLTITELQDSNSKPIIISATTINPFQKVLPYFKSITESTDLTTLKTQNKQPLWPAGQEPATADLSTAARSFKLLVDAHDSLPADGSISSTSSAAVRTKALESVGDHFMDGFHILGDQLESVENWGVELVDGVYHFVCNLFGEAKDFILDCVEKVGEAMYWVWQKIQLGWEKLVEFAGFLFAWDDIVATKDTLKAFLNAGLDYVDDKVEGWESQVDSFFNTIKGRLQNHEQGTSQVVPNSSSSQDLMSNTTSLKWVAERLMNGGAATGTLIPVDTTPYNGQSLADMLSPLGESLELTGTDAANDICNLFSQNGTALTADIFEKLGDSLLNQTVDLFQTLTTSLFSMLQDLISGLKKLGDGSINIPVLSAVAKAQTNEALSFFDLVCFLVAIPTTIITKIVTSSAPPSFGTVDDKFFASFIDGSLPSGTKADIATLFTGALTGITFIKGIYTAIKLLINAIPSVDNGVSFLTPSTATFVMGLVLDTVSLSMSLSTDTSLPGADIRQWISIVGLTRVGLATAYFLKSQPNDGTQLKIYSINLLVALVQFALYEAVYSEEQNTASYVGKDDQITYVGMAENGLNTIASCGTYLALTSKGEADAQATGMAIMEAANIGLGAAKCVLMNRSYTLGLDEPRGVLPGSS